MQTRQKFVILPLVQPTAEGSAVDKEKISQLCAQGLSECPPEDRAIAWLVLLGVFPAHPEDWKTTQEQMKALYMMLVDEFKVGDWTSRVFCQNVKKKEFELQDNDAMAVIHGDVVRTSRHFFFLPPEEIPKNANPSDIQAPFTYHIRRIERMLYVFAQTNPGLAYMQGFNELIIPLYYVLIEAKAMFLDDMIMIEAVTYSLFLNLLTDTDIQEFYATKDQSATIIHKLGYFEKLLKRYLPNTFKELAKMNLYPLLYAYRWFNILFGQEHELPVLLMIWDALFSHSSELIQYSFYVGVAQIKVMEKKIVPDNFPKTVEALQNLKIPNALSVIKEANVMWNDMKKHGKP